MRTHRKDLRCAQIVCTCSQCMNVLRHGLACAAKHYLQHIACELYTCIHSHVAPSTGVRVVICQSLHYDVRLRTSNGVSLHSKSEGQAHEVMSHSWHEV